MEIKKPNELTVKVSNLDDFINSKYQYKMNTESLRQEVLFDIENWIMQNKDVWSWERNESYRKSILEYIETTKLHYYTVLVNQSGLDDKIQRDMILKYFSDKNEEEWKSYVSGL